ncbi:recombinase family protein [Collinsella sp. LCP19S3_B11]|uniref:recombinase family protein n=1 Tax=Collinsella sp. LCP19S3_B11 TaxID=3438754 RepID=UPI003F925FC2
MFSPAELGLCRNLSHRNHRRAKFFVDDGFSGVSFEREGLQAMLQEVEAGRVATVITKDLSRLGRNYLKTGELIEIVFPENGVRYIAINDGVDTAREDNEFTPLRNWFNEFYARDTSKKIRAVKQAQAQDNMRKPFGSPPPRRSFFSRARDATMGFEYRPVR